MRCEPARGVPNQPLALSAASATQLAITMYSVPVDTHRSMSGTGEIWKQYYILAAKRCQPWQEQDKEGEKMQSIGSKNKSFMEHTTEPSKGRLQARMDSLVQIRQSLH